jgi:hypothetical protein
MYVVKKKKKENKNKQTKKKQKKKIKKNFISKIVIEHKPGMSHYIPCLIAE